MRHGLGARAHDLSTPRAYFCVRHGMPTIRLRHSRFPFCPLESAIYTPTHSICKGKRRIPPVNATHTRWSEFCPSETGAEDIRAEPDLRGRRGQCYGVRVWPARRRDGLAVRGSDRRMDTRTVRATRRPSTVLRPRERDRVDAAARLRTGASPSGGLPAVYSTELSIVGEGEWAAVKHGSHGQRDWKKLQLGVDPSGTIVAQALADSPVDAPPSATSRTSARRFEPGLQGGRRPRRGSCATSSIG